MSRKNRNRNSPFYGGKKFNDALTPADAIPMRLKQGWDPSYYASIYEQFRYGYGEPWRSSAAVPVSMGTSFPDYPDIRVQFQEIGKSRRIFNTQLIALAKVMGQDPSPEFPQVDKYTAEVRKQFVLARARQSNWRYELGCTFLDGDGTGLGFTQIGCKTNPETGKQYGTLQHVSCLRVLRDRHERNPARYRWIAFLHYIPVEKAVEMFGKSVADANKRPVSDGVASYPLECVRYWEYFDIGYAGGKPTRAIILSEFSNKPHLIEENVYGILPFSYYIHAAAPGQQHPVGRIPQLMPLQEARNEAEERIRKTTMDTPITIVDDQQLDSTDLAQWLGGKGPRAIRTTGRRTQSSGAPVERFPGAEVSEAEYKWVEMLDNEFTETSGVTDFDRGVNPSVDRTLGENVMVSQQGATSMGWSSQQAAEYMRMTVEVFLKIAKDFDTDPVDIDMFGRTYNVNAPGRPGSQIAEWLKDPSRIEIGVDTLRPQDAQMERQGKLNQLMALMPMVGKGIDPVKWVTEVAEAMGDPDPKSWVMQQQPQMPPQAPQGMQPGGMPMMPPQGAPMATQPPMMLR